MATRTLLLFVAVLAVAGAQPHAANVYEAQMERMWHTADTDNNGQMSRDELTAIFKNYDTDGDGRVSRDEYNTVVAADSPALRDYNHIPFDHYDHYDANQDHQLDNGDLDALYATMDVDGSGSVSEKEFFAYWHKVLADYAHLHAQPVG